MTKKRVVPYLIDRPMGFCPGCGHGIVLRLIAKCLEELGQDNNVIYGIGVGCSSLLGGGLEADRLHCSHGRAGAVCTAMKRVNPDNMVIAYQGDGDAYSIGLAETNSAAYRNENFTAIIINNTNYGMTGGQMSNTTMPGQKTATSPLGRNCEVTGYPIKFPELAASQYNVAYAARGSVSTPAHINKLKSYIKNAFEAQLNGEGYSVVEVLSACPTNWGMSAKDAMERIDKELIPYFSLGEFKTREGK
ncbi:2-oxoglutarate oxidoreductase subunit KorB [Clostridium acetireducens DSM 10703]|uniref:2-oxoglutarate oxidoreductase subunit KorB n=1 Tax=Clostridium acetireducens DSM 10703 TaxID=1121290 RepID=A0A1E8EXI3_9CLOT|nr:thiamine pyrophosphate-dependent enzyme [Clostridium acetireducens]OFI05498.1 2-oxoglutarate oxidoreductase subunit KorB [Clostridium acetireducens DSM 10703]